MKFNKTSSAMQQDYAKCLYEAIAAIQSPAEAEQFFNDLCTPNEIQAMADRWLAVAAIKAGDPYRKIHEQTGISVTTIGRVARCVLFGHGGYNLIFERTQSTLPTK